MIWLRNKIRAQSLLEMAVLTTVVVAALIAINLYVRKAVSARLKESSDQIGEQFDVQTTTSSFASTRSSQTKETTKTATGTFRTDYLVDDMNETGERHVGAPE